ncbi:MAG: hypothetical protein GY861_20875 [bacterium]|nr:hypothetical protein [bacterium]
MVKDFTRPLRVEDVVDYMTAYEALTLMEETSCDCAECYYLCKTPCIGTPHDIMNIINLGYARQLMLVGSDMLIIRPAYTGLSIRWIADSSKLRSLSSGWCSFVTEPFQSYTGRQKRCSIQDAKPLGGRIAIHYKHPVESKNQKVCQEFGVNHYRELIIATWASRFAEIVVERWVEEIGNDLIVL